MRIGLSTGYYENYWGDWLTAKQIGGSERIVLRLAEELARMGHHVTVRLPYDTHERVLSDVRLVGLGARVLDVDLLFAFDQFSRYDRAGRRVLVACRSDPPPHDDFDELIFLSRTHAEMMGHPLRPFVGGGVDLRDYTPRKRIRNRVICTSSPDRCPAATAIGSAFDFVHTYKPVNGVGVEYDRAALTELQQTAMVQVYPLDPVRPSDFFAMSVLEAMAAGTPVITSDADAMPELWGTSAVILPRPIRLSEWVETTEELMGNKRKWKALQAAGLARAVDLTWEKQAQRYLDIAMRS